MKYGKSTIPMLLASVLVFVGTLAINNTTCLGWFYEPKKPKAYKELSSKFPS